MRGTARGLRAAAALLAALAACRPAPVPAPAVAPVVAAPGLELVVRAGDPAPPALVVERRRVVLAAGDHVLALPDLGKDVRELTARVLGDPAATVRATVIDAPTGVVRLRIVAPHAGDHLLELRYAMPGVTARFEHTLTWREPGRALAPGPSRPELRSLVAIDNRTGRALRGARVTVVEAGEGERHALATPVDLGVGAEVRVPVHPTAAVDATRVVVFDGTGGSIALQAQELDASYGTAPAPARAERELRLPGLRRPAGHVRVVEDGVLLAEAELVPHADGARIALGPAPGVTGRRTRLEMRWKTRRLVESFAVTVRNEGATDEHVVVRELAYRSPSWRLVESSVPAASTSERVIELPVQVASGQTVRLTLVVEYNW